MKKTNIHKLVFAAVLVALAVVGSLISFPIGASKCAPVQHLVNIIGAVFLVPAWAVGVGFTAALLRNLLGLGSLLAFPGSAIGGAIAAASGADFLCYVTPAEHLRLPDVDDVKEGIIASKIAAHAADIAKGVKGARDIDDKMAAARHKMDWDEMFEIALDGEKARRFFEQTPPADRHTCSMCGKMCAVRTTNMILEGKEVKFCSEK